MHRSLTHFLSIIAVSGFISACSVEKNAALGSSEASVGAGTAATDTSSDNQIERPDYTVIKTAAAPTAFDGPIELRRYEPTIVAETTVRASNHDVASSKGFRPLADFIFGKNRPNTKIAMTSPVTTSPKRGEEIAMTAPVTTAPSTDETDNTGNMRDYTVRFTMPAKYTMETLPRPIDPTVDIVALEARNLVAVRFIGRETSKRIKQGEQTIAAFVNDNELESDGTFAVAGYDGPSVPVSQRRWEVHLPVK